MDEVIDVLNRFNSVNYYEENFPTTEEAGDAINFCMKIKNKWDKIEKILLEPDEVECNKQKKVLVSSIDTTNCELLNNIKYPANVKFRIPDDLPKEIKKIFVDNFAGKTNWDGTGWSAFCSWKGFYDSIKTEVSFYDVFHQYSKNYMEKT